MTTSLTSYNPLGELSDIRERLDRAFDELTSRGGSHRLTVDVIEEDDRYLMRADVPGISPDEIKIEVDGDRLTVSGSHEESSEEKKDDYVRRERRFGSFSRSMLVPRGVDPDEIEATTANGVLEISIPKPKPADDGGTKVEIKPKAKAE